MNGRESHNQSEVSQPASVRRVVEYFTSEDQHPAIRVVGEYIRAHEITGTLDEHRTLRAIQSHARTLTRGRVMLSSFLDRSLGYCAGEGSGDAKDAAKSIPEDVAAFIHGYTDKVNCEIEATTARAAESLPVQEACTLLRGVVECEKQTERPLNEWGKSRMVRENFILREHREPERQDVWHPTYRDAMRQSEFATISETGRNSPLGNGKGGRLEQLQQDYARIVKSAYDGIQSRRYRTYRPSDTEITFDCIPGFSLAIKRNGEDAVKPLEIRGLGTMIYYSGVLATDPAYYNVVGAQETLLRLCERYFMTRAGVSEERREDYMDFIQDAVCDPAAYLHNDNKLTPREDVPFFRLAEIVHWLQRSGGYVWDADWDMKSIDIRTAIRAQKACTNDKPKGVLGKLALLGQAFRGKNTRSEFFDGLMASGKDAAELTSFYGYVQSKTVVHAVMTGNPLYVMRFPELSVFPHDLRWGFTFIDWRQLSHGTDLSSKVTVANRKKYLSLPHEPDKMYLALSPYAPMTTLELSGYAGKRREAGVRLDEGSDYKVLYQPETGHYCVQLLSEKALGAGRAGIWYAAGLDLPDKQKGAPKLVTTLELSRERAERLCTDLRYAGLGYLSVNLYQCLEADRSCTSDTIAKAIEASVYYSFGHSSDETKSDAAPSTAQYDDDLDLSFLSKEVFRNGHKRFGVQCAQANGLLAACINASLPRKNVLPLETSEKAYTSCLFTSAADWTAPLGARVYTAAHADTRLVGDGFYFQKDVTPGLSCRSVVDAAKSSLQGIRRVFFQALSAP